MIGDKILHRIFGEEFAKLRTKLRGECFVVRQNERRLVHVGDDVCHGERLARAGDAEQYLFPVAAQHTFCELFDRLRLVAGRLICGNLSIDISPIAHMFSIPHRILIVNEKLAKSPVIGYTKEERR